MPWHWPFFSKSNYVKPKEVKGERVSRALWLLNFDFAHHHQPNTIQGPWAWAVSLHISRSCLHALQVTLVIYSLDMSYLLFIIFIPIFHWKGFVFGLYILLSFIVLEPLFHSSKVFGRSLSRIFSPIFFPAKRPLPISQNLP